MGFTRTSEGRVFFKGADNDDAPRLENSAPPTEPVMNVDQTQMQILLLLKSLNTKLKSSKEEQSAMKRQLAAYKDTIKQIKEKSGGYEANYIDLEQKVARKQTEAQKQVTRVEDTLKDTLKQLEEARKLVEELESKTESSTETLDSLKMEVELRKQEEEKILKRQKELEKLNAAQGEKMVDNVAAYVALTKRVSESETRQAALDNKIEETTSEYLKLDRKIDKSVEDRNRILRKIERIEAAVLETRDALNAKAMVLLTQQGASPSAVEYPQISEIPDPREVNESKWWKKPVQLNPASLAAMLFGVLVLSWILSYTFTPVNPTQDETYVPIKTSALAPPYQSPPSSTDPLLLKTELDPRLIPDEGKIAAIKPETLIEEPVKENKDYSARIHDGTEEKMAALMEKDPEKVAEKLNKIEPSQTASKVSEEPAQIVVANIEPPPEEPNKRTAAQANSYKIELRKLLSPDPNLTDAAKRIETQAFEGIPEAQHDMGAIYVAGHGAIKQDLSRAVFWFEQASSNGIANAQYNLGVLYHQGLGVEKNLEKAITLYQKAAAQGHPEAQYNLGIANIEGIGVPYNPQKAAMYFENAANKNIMEAAYNLGLIYENGLLGETHPDEALMWYKTAADNGSPEAKAALDQLASSLGIALSDVNRVVEKTRASKKGTKQPTEQDSQQFITSEIQKELMERGLYPGPVDGMNGPMTANAIKNFQSASNLAADGIPSKDLLNYMRTSRY